MSFRDSLLKAQGFENHYLINRLGHHMRHDLTKRLPAMAKRRFSPIDKIMRNLADIISSPHVHLDNEENEELAAVSWGVTGTSGRVTKETEELVIYSTIPAIMGGVVLEEDEPIIGKVELWDSCPDFSNGSWVSLDRITEHAYATSDSYVIEETELGQAILNHPGNQICRRLLRWLHTPDTGFTWIGQDQLENPTMWFFRCANDTRCLVLTIDHTEIIADLKLLGMV